MTQRHRTLWVSSLAALGVATLITACGDHSTQPCGNGTIGGDIHEPWPDQEAELLALVMSDEICAPLGLYEQVQTDLERIRADWGDYIPKLREVRGRAPWVAGQLILGLTQETSDAIAGGEYHHWDDLNDRYDIDTLYLETICSLIEFVPRLNPTIIAPQYASLPGIYSAHPNYTSGFGTGVFSSISNGERWYVFQHAWGDCPMGCMYRRSWHFRADDAKVLYLGYWEHDAAEVFTLRRHAESPACFPVDRIGSAVITRNSEYRLRLRGGATRLGDPVVDPCPPSPDLGGACVLGSRFPDRILTQVQTDSLYALLAAIPDVERPINFVCDPCLITTYEFDDRIVEANPCAAPHAEFDESIAKLEAFLHDLVFDD